MSERGLRSGMLVFPNLTQLDLTGPYEVLSRLPGAETLLLWKDLQPVRTEHGLAILPTAALAECPLLDLVLVPGGPGINPLLEDQEVLSFLRDAAARARYVVSVCTGSLVLGAAGLLRGRRAATHWMSRDLLPAFGAEPVPERVVRDGNLFTGGGVTAGIDVALTVAAEIAGPKTAQAIQLAIRIRPGPALCCGLAGGGRPRNCRRGSRAGRSAPARPGGTRRPCRRGAKPAKSGCGRGGMKTIRIDYAKRLAGEPEKGHNRWHEAIAPVIEVVPGEEVEIDTRDAFDGQISPTTTAEDLRGCDLNLVHPLTGPVFVAGAAPGDLLEVEIRDMKPAAFAYTVQVPGFGFLRDAFPEPYIAKWAIKDGFAESTDLPGVRIPDGSFVGVIGVAPSKELREKVQRREAELAARGGLALPPEVLGAVPGGAIAAEALRTIPPRENGGNLDIKQLSKGARLLLPVFVEGALFSVGDAHFAQGDGEACGTAIEMCGSILVRFSLLKGEAERRGIRFPRFARDDYYFPPELAAPKRFLATTGMSVRADGGNESEDATLSARNALLSMIDLLVDRGWSRQQAYAICSVAVDLKLSELVDVPNIVVSAFLPLDIFGK